MNYSISHGEAQNQGDARRAEHTHVDFIWDEEHLVRHNTGIHVVAERARSRTDQQEGFHASVEASPLPTPEATDFGQSRFGHPDLANLGQSHVGQSILGSGVCHGGAQKGVAQKGGAGT